MHVNGTEWIKSVVITLISIIGNCGQMVQSLINIWAVIRYRSKNRKWVCYFWLMKSLYRDACRYPARFSGGATVLAVPSCQKQIAGTLPSLFYRISLISADFSLLIYISETMHFPPLKAVSLVSSAQSAFLHCNIRD